jgi:hypothetical protein
MVALLLRKDKPAGDHTVVRARRSPPFTGQLGASKGRNPPPRTSSAGLMTTNAWGST